MEYVLTTDCLNKKYRHFQALNNFTMRVPKGSIYGFVGRNGAGKTTLIRLICGLQIPTSGSFVLYGTRNDCKAIGKSRRLDTISTRYYSCMAHFSTKTVPADIKKARKRPFYKALRA